MQVKLQSESKLQLSLDHYIKNYEEKKLEVCSYSVEHSKSLYSLNFRQAIQLESAKQELLIHLETSNLELAASRLEVCISTATSALLLA